LFFFLTVGKGIMGEKGCSKRFLRLTGLSGRRVLRFDGPLGRGLWWRLAPQFLTEAAPWLWFKGFRGLTGPAAPKVMAACGGRLCRRVVVKVLKIKRLYGLRVMVSPLRAMSIKTALRDCLPASHCHPERKRRISVHAVSVSFAVNTSRREGAAIGGSPPLVPNGTTFPPNGGTIKLP
jgi:hypothetical protein